MNTDGDSTLCAFRATSYSLQPSYGLQVCVVLVNNVIGTRCDTHYCGCVLDADTQDSPY